MLRIVNTAKPHVEEKDLNGENKYIITHLTEAIQNITHPEQRIRALVNCTARMFNNLNTWNMPQPGQRYAIAERFIKNLWLNIPEQYRTAYRAIYISRPIIRCANKSIVEKYTSYIDTVLPQ